LNDKAQVQLTEHSVTNDFSHINFEERNKRDEEEIDVDTVKELIASRRGIVFG